MSTAFNRSNGEKERVRDASDIVRLVGEHVSLKPKGREFVGLCPFHDDHKPSMYVVPAKQIFHCFVCGAGGDVFSFVQRFHKMEFREALEYLAERANIELAHPARPEGDTSGPEVSRADMVRANSAACDYFRGLLRHTQHGAPARRLIERRGIAPEMVEAFRLGVSANRWDGLVLTAPRTGVPVEMLLQAGLVKRREGSDGYYDVFRDRLMFPIMDEAGRVIAFGARRIDDADEPKYLNSPETRLFEKSSTLYGLHQAARAIQAERVAVVTEGYTDVIACHQAGMTNVVATLGTALTRGHASRLRRYCDVVVLLFDGDEAGAKAADRAVEIFLGESLDVRIATLSAVTDAKDPDELLKRPGGADTLRAALDAARDLLAYRYDRLRATVGAEASGAAALGRIVEDELARMVELGLNELPPLRRRLIIRQLASIAGVDERTIQQMTPAGRQGVRPPAEAERSPARVERPRREQLLGCLLADPSLWVTVGEVERRLIEPGRFEEPAARHVATLALEIAGAEGACTLEGILVRLDEDTDTKAEAVALVEHVRGLTGDGVRLREHWEECVRFERLDAEREREVEGADADGLGRLRALRAQGTATGGDRRIIPRPTWAS